MSNYTKTTNFTAKDTLPTGNAAKVVRGSEFDTEFNNIQTAVNSKSNLASPIFSVSGTVEAGNITASGTVTAAAISLTGAFTGTIDGGSYY
jgi:hypothetical protein